MSSAWHFLALASIGEWVTTFSLIFGGCCSNALTLELITSQFPPAGTLITFAQFLLVSFVGLRKQLVILPRRVSKNVALSHVATELSKKRNILPAERPITVRLVHGTNLHETNAFLQELANFIRRTLPTVDAVVLEGHDHSGERKRFSLQDRDRFNNGSSPCSDDDGQRVHNILLIPAGSDSSSIDVLQQQAGIFTLAIEWSNVSPKMDSLAADMILDFTEPNHPAILHPHRYQMTFNPLRLRFKPRRIPLTRYAIQVALFLLISLLNNAAFAYHVPMAVHIIFRSGGLVVNMLMGWLIEKRRYTRIQIFSVVLVTLGVALTTLSSTQSKPRRSPKNASVSSLGVESTSYRTYAMGISILSLALLLSGFLGISQDKAFEQYGRGNWEEAMFYLHALALPLFSFVRSDLVSQLRMASSGPKIEVGLHSIVLPLHAFVDSTSVQFTSSSLPPLPYLPVRLPTLKIPSFYIPLLLNVLTQFLCVSGVNRLTSRVNSLTVTLALVVRKAASLAISVLLLGGSKGNAFLWVGAAAVLVGTVGYALGGRKASKKED